MTRTLISLKSNFYVLNNLIKSFVNHLTMLTIILNQLKQFKMILSKHLLNIALKLMNILNV